MVKDFAAWHKQKAILQATRIERYFYEREVWWTAIGLNIGFEEDGKHEEHSRPVLVTRKFNERFFLGIPLSTVARNGRYYYRFENSPGYTTALLSQIRALDTKRLINKDGQVSTWDHALIKLQLSKLLL